MYLRITFVLCFLRFCHGSRLKFQPLPQATKMKSVCHQQPQKQSQQQLQQYQSRSQSAWFLKVTRVKIRYLASLLKVMVMDFQFFGWNLLGPPRTIP